MLKKSLRHLKILTLVPTAPQRVGTARLVDQLHAFGFEATPRMVQRDLAELASAFPLESDDESPTGWSWPRAVPRHAAKLADPVAAAVLLIAKGVRRDRWPERVRRYVDAHAALAAAIVETCGDDELRRFGRDVTETREAPTCLASDPRRP